MRQGQSDIGQEQLGSSVAARADTEPDLEQRRDRANRQTLGDDVHEPAGDASEDVGEPGGTEPVDTDSPNDDSEHPQPGDITGAARGDTGTLSHVNDSDRGG